MFNKKCNFRAACYIGYLPGEVINRSVLYLLHPYDIAQIKQLHATLSMQRGEIVRQRRLRWVAFNGSIIHTNSEWFAFWNPWTRKVDSVIGRHTLNEQPVGSADVLAEPCAPRIVTPLDEITIRNIELEIAANLNKEPAAATNEKKIKAAPVAHQKNSGSPGMIASCTNFETTTNNLAETLVISAGTSGSQHSTLVLDARRSPVSPTDLSPNYNSALPLSYNQINCLENVHRLLKSQQRTAAAAAAVSATAVTTAAVPTVTDLVQENGPNPKASPCEESKSPLPVPEQDDCCRYRLLNGFESVPDFPVLYAIKIPE
ncbi:unnamed protein product [Gongylonema pulchrum]|uniref:PAS domain-containing protein n=1 Tax=Gongylonema pulchrum TaxID=637853 RepID=A0A3P6QYP8_9BILA|nr:unnamed protein product [Gongylonema pulchrum]